MITTYKGKFFTYHNMPQKYKRKPARLGIQTSIILAFGWTGAGQDKVLKDLGYFNIQCLIQCVNNQCTLLHMYYI